MDIDTEKKPKFDVVDMVTVPGRFVIVDTETGEVIDDAQGYGYKDKTKAYKAGWYKFGGGKNKIDECHAWWKKHAEFDEELDEVLCRMLKEGDPDKCGDLAQMAFDEAQRRGYSDYKKEYYKRR